MKRLRKIAAAVLAMVMVLAMNVSVFADETTKKPTAEDKANIVVMGVEKDADVYAYQYVKANYGTNGFTGYSMVDGFTVVKDIENPTLDEVVALTGDIKNNNVKGIKLAYVETAKSYSAVVPAGSYVILVKNVKEKIYNPMVVSVQYDKDKSGSDNTVDGGVVNAETYTWTLDGGKAIAKSSTPSIDKEIVLAEGETPDVAVGDTVEFKITTTIPEYSSDYEEVTFTVNDTLSKGLTFNKDSVAIAIDGTATTDVEAEVAENDSQKVTFDFSDIALDNIGKTVVITYTATLNENADYNYDANTNSVTLVYSNDPDSDSTGTTGDTTYTYSFKIEKLITKVDEKDNNLKGATFTLTNTKTNKVYTSTSDKDGDVSFEGLDAGTYTLVETAAPEGYTINDHKYEVVISAEYENEQIVEDSIVITFDNEDSAIVKDTKLIALPATGGIGTTIFTVLGCLLMIGAVALFFVNRRKANN